MVDGSISEADKLLICLAIIIVLTIVWTIIIGIMYKMNERKHGKTKTLIIDDDDDEDEEIVVKKEKTKKTKKSNLETYVKIKYYRSNKNLIYIAPKKTELVDGQKIKVRLDDDTIRTATVVKGNYTREKYKSNDYEELDIVEL